MAGHDQTVTEEPICWYITYSDDYGYDNVFFFPTEELAQQAIEDMDAAIEEGAEFQTYRGNRPIPFYPSDIKEKLDI